jgi:hypothetical protein
MNEAKRPAILLSITALAMILCAAWALGFLSDERAAAGTSAQELIDCRELGRRIVASRAGTAKGKRPADLTTAIGAAAAQAGLGPESLDHIDPSAAGHSGDGGDNEQQIDLSLRQGTLPQIVTFAHALSTAPLSLTVSRLRLTPSPADGGGWAAEMTLTCPVDGDRGR